MRSQTLAEARWILAILGVLLIASWFVSTSLSILFLLLIVFTLAFFRDPDRDVPSDQNLIVAAADGKITDIIDIDENEILKTKTQRVGIFLSIFDVHTNRAPIGGRVIYRQHRQGLCLDARRPECSEKNEAMIWAFQDPRVTIGPATVVIIAEHKEPLPATVTDGITLFTTHVRRASPDTRRIVAWSQIGDELQKGERFGMIRFGSRTEVYLPLNAEVLVQVGDHVLGGSTIIARLP